MFAGGLQDNKHIKTSCLKDGANSSGGCRIEVFIYRPVASADRHQQFITVNCLYCTRLLLSSMGGYG